MAEEKTKNVYAKLIEARKLFLEKNVKKSGKNFNLQYKYFELGDIIPVATTIFAKLGLVAITTFTEEEAILKLVNCDEPTDCIEFTTTLRDLSAIVSREGKIVTNVIQTQGSAITYYRRYLYQLCLDICESDFFDSDLNPENEKKEKESKKSIPATPKERANIKKELTNVEEPASEFQIKALKKALKELKQVAPEREDFIIEFVKKTDNFKSITKQQAESCINNISDVISAIKQPPLVPQEEIIADVEENNND